MNIKDIIKDNMVEFGYAREGKLYYFVQYNEKWYQFPVPFDDIKEVGNATFNATDKAIYFMRYIRKAIDNNDFIETNKRKG